MTRTSPEPLVSIVTPSLNQAEFVEATMRSVLDQDYPRIEYLVLDGGSTDGSAAIVARHADRLAYWCSGPDGGQSEAVDRGWRMARGGIVAYLNSDDLYTPGAVTAAVRFFAEHPEVGIAYGACEIFDAGGTVCVSAPLEFDLRRLLLDNFIPQPSTFLRREVLDRVGDLDAGLRYCMDYDLWVRAAVAGVVLRRIPGPPLARFRVWPGAKTSRAAQAGLAERLAILERAFATPRLAATSRGFRAHARACACLTIAYGELLNGDMVSARRYLRRSVGCSPRVLGDRRFLALGLASALGGTAARALRRVNQRARRLRRAGASS